MPSTKFSGAWLCCSWWVLLIVGLLVDSLFLSELVFSIIFDHKVWIHCCCCCCCLIIHLVVLGYGGGNPLLTYHEIITKCTKHDQMSLVPYRSRTSTMVSIFRFFQLEAGVTIHYQPKQFFPANSSKLPVICC